MQQPSPVKSSLSSMDGMPTYQSDDRGASNQDLPGIVTDGRAESRNDWADASHQVDHFFAASNPHEYVYNTAFPEYTISPLRRGSERKQANPSQEMNYHSDEDSMKPPPLPPLTSMAEEYPSQELNLPQYSRLEMLAITANANATPGSRVVSSMPPPGLTKESSGGTTNVLDSFEMDDLDVPAATGRGQPKVEGLDEHYCSGFGAAPSKVSMSPVVPSDPKATKSRKTKAKGKKASKNRATTKGNADRKPSSKRRKVDVTPRVPSTDGIVHPNDLDVLKGRGGFTNRHVGNKRFREEARQMRGLYRNKKTTPEQKYEISQELADRVAQYGGRFLEKGADGLWYQMDDYACRKKASQVLREANWD